MPTYHEPEVYALLVRIEDPDTAAAQVVWVEEGRRRYNIPEALAVAKSRGDCFVTIYQMDENGHSVALADLDQLGTLNNSYPEVIDQPPR